MDTDEAIRSINESFDRLIMGARRSMREAAGRLAPDLQPAAWPVFREVIRTGRVQASAIVTALAVDKSAVSRHIKELRELGLVDATRDEHDARVIWITPTTLALHRVDAISTDQQARLRGVLEDWSPEDLERFAGLLSRFALPADGTTD